MRRPWAAGGTDIAHLSAARAILLSLSLVVTSVTACSELRLLVKGKVGDFESPDRDVPCQWLGDAYRYTGSILPWPDNPWIPTTNSVRLQYDKACLDVFGYAEYYTRLDDPMGKTEVSTARISFKGRREDLDGARFERTAYVDLDITCEGACEGYEPYAFDYPATWWAEIAPQGETIRG